MIKRFNSFVKESVENKGKGVGGENDLFPSAPKKQTINRAIPTMDFLRIGKHILTKKIDGFIDSVQNESIFITDRITGETKKYTLKEVLKELTQAKAPEKGDSFVKGFEGTPTWATKQKIYEDYEPEREREYEPEGPDTDVAEEEQELEYGDEEEAQQAEIEYGDEEEADTDNDQEDADAVPSNNLRNKILYGTEDNPEGIPNKGDKRDMPNESWIKYWEKFNQKQVKLVTEDLEEEVEQEEEAPIIRGTEDNPLPDKRKTKIESYE